MNHSNKYLVNMVSTLPDGKCGIGTYTDYIINELENRNITVRLVPLELNCNNAIYYFKKAFKSARSCNIVHIQFEYHLFGNKYKLTGIFSLLYYPILKILSYFRGFRIVTTMHEIYEPARIKDILIDLIKKPDKNTIYVLYAFLRHFIIVNSSDQIIVLSELNQDKLVQSRVKPEKIVQISHGTDVPTFLNEKKCKQELGIDPGKKMVTIFGMISYHKGHDIFIKAAQEFDSDVVFCIAGEPKSDEDRKYFETIETQVPKNTIYLGFISQENIPVLFNATDIMVLPYRSGFVSGVFELTMSYQIPTITSDLPSFSEIKRKYDCISLFEINNKDSLKKAIREILKDAELQMKLINNTRLFADENSITKAVEQTLFAYRELL